LTASVFAFLGFIEKRDASSFSPKHRGMPDRAEDCGLSTGNSQVPAFERLEHDPEKWKPVFGKDHAQTKR
jgi:hypothetical protein